MKLVTPAYISIHLGTRQVPEIDGSQGAFIGLVVALSVLIIACCAAVFYLLRHHEPTDQDRVARRERFRRTREHALNSSSSVAGPPASSTVIGLGSLGDKMKHLWQSTTGIVTGGSGGSRRGGRGWIRAGSHDEWAPHSDHEVGRAAEPERERHTGSFPVVLDQDVRESRGEGEGDGVRVVESPTSGFVSMPYAYAYTNPFSKMASHEETSQQSQSPLSSPVSSPRGSTSVDESPRAHSPSGDQYDHRHRSTMSNGSVWTQGGSKFVEDI